MSTQALHRETVKVGGSALARPPNRELARRPEKAQGAGAAGKAAKGRVVSKSLRTSASCG